MHIRTRFTHAVNCVTDTTITVNIDYEKLAKVEQEKHEGFITVSGAGSTDRVSLRVYSKGC